MCQKHDCVLFAVERKRLPHFAHVTGTILRRDGNCSLCSTCPSESQYSTARGLSTMSGELLLNVNDTYRLLRLFKDDDDDDK